MISEKEGVNEIKVSLELKEAKVSYNDDQVTAEEIANFIEEMGFDAHVKSSEAQKKSIAKQTLPQKPANGTVVTMNGGGDSRFEEPSKCFLKVQVSICYLLLVFVWAIFDEFCFL